MRLSTMPPPGIGRAGNDVVDTLIESHERTRRLLRLARQVVEGRCPGHEITTVAERMHRFFTFWNVMHEVDEEHSVAPAVHAFAPKEQAEAALDRMVAEHKVVEALREPLGHAWLALAREPRHFASLEQDLAATTRVLTRMLLPHMAVEERTVFPLLRAYVPRPEQLVMLNVMRARRGGAMEPRF